MMLLQFSASQGPVECALAVSKALHYLQLEARALKLEIDILESVPGPKAGTFRSVLVALEGEAAAELAKRWVGTVQWICASPYRPQHSRKNWFIGVQQIDLAPENAKPEADRIIFTACKASGPGGQHVNKTESAIRATDPVTGLSVKVQSERSQHANKRLALQLLASKAATIAQEQAAANRQSRHDLHWRVDRGGAVRVFYGLEFQEHLKK